MAWMDGLWDDEASLLWATERDRHLTRETAWYAFGLLQRRNGDDLERAGRALRRVSGEQLDAPGEPYDGTFRRAPEEADPPDEAVMWVHYDPNWRQFIGTTFAVICDRYGADLGPEIEGIVREAIDRAVGGEPDGRVSPTYANIALMKAWLDAWAGREDAAHSFAEDVAAAFAEHGAFLEYNSPTYYGIDIYGLALWRNSTPTLAALAKDMETTLWRDVAAFYHAGLRNLCGPHDRAYGMDMTSYATPLGLWLWSTVGAERAPFPDPAGPIGHRHDFCFAPLVSAFEPSIPDDVALHLGAFRGERNVERTVTSDPARTATAWLADDVMMGGWSGPPSGIGWYQHHHATIHWRREDGSIGWVRLRPETHADASASPGELRIKASSPGPVTFDVRPLPRLQGATWSFDEIALSVETDAGEPALGDGAVVYDPPAGSATFVICPR